MSLGEFRQTCDCLRCEKVMNFELYILHWKCVLNSMIKLLQNYATKNIGLLRSQL